MALRRAKADALEAAAALDSDSPAVPAAPFSASAAPLRSDPPHILRVTGDLSLLVERLHDEYTKSLQHSDPHKTEYVVRIADEQTVASLADRGFDYYRRIAAAESAAAVTVGTLQSLPSNAADMSIEPAVQAQAAMDAAARLAILRAEHMYYKTENVGAQVRRSFFVDFFAMRVLLCVQGLLSVFLAPQ